MLLDFPGLNDSQDSENKFFGFIETNKDLPHIFMFITSIESAFNHGSELKYFERVLEIVKKQNSEGIYAEIIVVVNKYDEEYDEEYEEIMSNLPDVVISNAKIFRISSHRLLCQHIKLTDSPFQVPETYKREFSRIIRNSGAVCGEGNRVQFSGKFDVNNLLGYINDIDVHGEEYKHMFRSLKEYDCTQDCCAKLNSKLAKLYELNPQFGGESGFISWIDDTMLKLNDVAAYDIIREFLMCICDDPRLDSIVRGGGMDDDGLGFTWELIVESIINQKGRNIDQDSLSLVISFGHDIYKSPMWIVDNHEIILARMKAKCVGCGQEATIKIDTGTYCQRKVYSFWRAERCVACNRLREDFSSVCGKSKYICKTCAKKYPIAEEWGISVLDTILAFKDNPDDLPLKRLKSLIHLSRTSVKDIVTMHTICPELLKELFPDTMCKDFMAKTMELYHENKLSTHGSWIYSVEPISRINDMANLIFGKYPY